ncbi:hypothetical protein HYW21_07795 [Candidatus Woesearchaeota archaeon]|nr:hypothetical protein [Candidatus Woesearchaeota archaeon]
MPMYALPSLAEPPANSGLARFMNHDPRVHTLLRLVEHAAQGNRGYTLYWDGNLSLYATVNLRRINGSVEHMFGQPVEHHLVLDALPERARTYLNGATLYIDTITYSARDPYGTSAAVQFIALHEPYRAEEAICRLVAGHMPAKTNTSKSSPVREVGFFLNQPTPPRERVTEGLRQNDRTNAEVAMDGGNLEGRIYVPRHKLL